VDAKDEKARKYYEQFGFIPMQDNKQQLCLVWKLVQKTMKIYGVRTTRNALCCRPPSTPTSKRPWFQCQCGQAWASVRLLMRCLHGLGWNAGALNCGV